MNKLGILLIFLSLACYKANCQSDSIRVEVSVDTSVNNRFYLNIGISSSKNGPVKVCDSFLAGEIICNTSCLIVAFQILHKDCFDNRVIECAFPIYPKSQILKDFTKDDTIHLRLDISDYFDYVIKTTGKVSYSPNTYRFSLIFNYYSLNNKEYSAYSDWIYVAFK